MVWSGAEEDDGVEWSGVEWIEVGDDGVDALSQIHATPLHSIPPHSTLLHAYYWNTNIGIDPSPTTAPSITPNRQDT